MMPHRGKQKMVFSVMRKKDQPLRPSDLAVEPHGSVVLLVPVTAAGRAWVEENVLVEPWQMLGEKIAMEPRYVAGVLAGAVSDGLSWERR